jgi:WD40 repeat protein
MVTHVRFVEEGARIAVAWARGPVLLSDPATGSAERSVRPPGPTGRAALSDDGKRALLSAEGGASSIWDFSRGAAASTLRLPGGIPSLAVLSRDGGRLLTVSPADPGTAVVWDASTGERLHVLRGHGDAILAAAFTPGGEEVVTASADTSVRAWDLSSVSFPLLLRAEGGEPFAAVPPANAPGAAFGADGTRVVAVRIDGAATVWDAVTGVETHALRAAGGAVGGGPGGAPARAPLFSTRSGRSLSAWSPAARRRPGTPSAARGSRPSRPRAQRPSRPLWP